MATETQTNLERDLPEQGPSGVWHEEDGESWWQPEPANGHVTLKVTPDTFPSNLFSVGLQYIDPGCALREHGAEAQVGYVAEVHACHRREGGARGGRADGRHAEGRHAEG